ncbi:hypothetical protein [Vibrio sp. SCSIO 43136]|uniref:hypothetical protein n=1 Tax=Vibrio sp. SCSIO 43136 TaxID=2819101 RepID=UPI0020751198|nr:hypothetical protein [Vibrio sp. SCSIO 43136]USD67415.1 hypothetical protein J4N39_22575 [Vibrio sp. SCSIO 43136]
MNKDAAAELGQLIVSQDELMTILANNLSALDNYPHLKAHVAKKNPNTHAYHKLSAEKKKEFFAVYDERLFWLTYEVAQGLYHDQKLDFLIERAALLVGDDIPKLNSLTIEDIGVEIMVKYLNMISNTMISNSDKRPSFPWMAEKGRWDPKFWANAHLAYDAWRDGYSSHYKLDNWCKDQLDCRAPQSCIKFFKSFGDPRKLPEWADKYSDNL